MKIYEFPYGGAEWDAVIDFELTDDEAARLEASAQSKPRWHLNEDKAISDIFHKIEQAIYEENKQMMIKDGRLDEARETWKALNEDEDEEDMPSDDELVEEEMGTWHVCYPKHLQFLEKDEEE